MKNGFYVKTACGNICKNYRFFIPRMLTEAGLLGSFYIVMTLTVDRHLREIKGGNYLPDLMAIGSVVIAFLSVVLMLYSNSFLMKQRKREFGLYSVLGMEKRHIKRVMLFESLISGFAAIAAGLLFGMLFYKLSTLLICRLLSSQAITGFYFLSVSTMARSAVLFVVIDLLTYLLNCLSVDRLKPVELLASRHVGEKEPKVKWLMLALGVVLLGCGYYWAVTVKSPLQALMYFFLAVFAVMIGTYFLFVSGSIFVLKRLKNKPSYYYRKRHMTAVSGLLYRMKQNAVGLASIAILSCGVLVMISTTVSLFVGMADSLDSKYPQDFYISVTYRNTSDRTVNVPKDELTDSIQRAAQETNLTIRSADLQEYLEVAFPYRHGRIELTDPTAATASDAQDVCNFVFITAERYNMLSGTRLSLSGNEVALSQIATDLSNAGQISDTLLIGREAHPIKETLSYFPIWPHLISTNTYGVVVADDTALAHIDELQRELYGLNASQPVTRVAVAFADRQAACDAGEAFSRAVHTHVDQLLATKEDHTSDSVYSYREDSYWETKSDVLGMYGAFLFLGILLGLVCLFATGLIIYYKQISEGYEDRDRFQIMQKIGMSRVEVRQTVHSQIVTVFFLPLLVAGVHLAFAFPLLTRLLHLLLYSGNRLFILCTVVVYLVYCLVYYGIYRATARSYCKIVS